MTARSDPLGNEAEAITRTWLLNNQIDTGDEIIITHHTESKVKSFPKDTNLVVDDASHVVIASEAAGLPVLVPDHPWNRHLELKNPLSARVRSMRDMHEALVRVRQTLGHCESETLRRG